MVIGTNLHPGCDGRMADETSQELFRSKETCVVEKCFKKIWTYDKNILTWPQIKVFRGNWLNKDYDQSL